MNKEENKIKLRAWVHTKKQLISALACEYAEAVYTPLFLIDESMSETERKKTIILPPEYLADNEEKVRHRLCELDGLDFMGAAAHTVGHIELLSGTGFEIYGTSRLNCVNSESLAFYAEAGVRDIILSVELSAERMRRLRVPDGVKIGFMAYGYLPLMLLRRCPIADGKPCGRYISGGCGKKLTDRRGNKLSVICRENSVEVLNSDVLWLADKLSSFAADNAVLRFTTEEETSGVIASYMNEEAPPWKGFTRGLYFREVF